MRNKEIAVCDLIGVGITPGTENDSPYKCGEVRELSVEDEMWINYFHAVTPEDATLN